MLVFQTARDSDARFNIDALEKVAELWLLVSISQV
jgi:hypothetical protein